ncbi:hypothetical protein SCHPADRAFT_846921 [Schizopora paradoxa]|uniref:Uncharacterized protein n=1 Tax=Schizopora paradoxa TaxID=27342 RepID=A0A0H2RYQ4_9AGAM|nr:hypothetical protein SCHPADRAFT_846921 [Schizopora paradoxa]
MLTSTFNTEDEAFFKERLDMFMQKNLSDISDFSEREGRDLESTRRAVAEWHASWLFNSTIPLDNPDSERPSQVTHFVEKISENLENMHGVTGQHSLLIVVDPTRKDDDGIFVGGTSTGRTFWNGLRGGGRIGARQFKQQCRSIPSKPEAESSTVTETTTTQAGPSRQTPAVALKNNLYNEMRSALRQASGNSAAEMKWSKPEKLASLGVQLVGWPPSVPFKNPSRMSQQEMTLIRSLLMNKEISFVRKGAHPIDPPTTTENTAAPVEDVDISWAVQDDGDDNNLDERPAKRQRELE